MTQELGPATRDLLKKASQGDAETGRGHVGTILPNCPGESPVRLVQQNQRGPMVRLGRRLWSQRRSWQFHGAIGTLVALCALLLIPFPYRIACDLRLQPVARRFVAAPFAGTVQRTICEPGQVVARDQLLAQLDDREIRWDLAGRLAEHQRADKERQVAVASHDTATGTIDTVERLEHELRAKHTVRERIRRRLARLWLGWP